MMVDNAISIPHVSISHLTLEHCPKDFAPDADAVFVGTKVIAKAGKGAIVNVASICAIRAAAMECARTGIHVNAIVPGQVQTAGTGEFTARAPDIASRTAEAIPMGHGGRPKELAEAIVFMLSDAISYICGTALPVDRGTAAQLHLAS